jgi:hypothetical protein
MNLAERMTLPGNAKPDSRMYKRGYIINLAPNAVKKPTAAVPKPPKEEPAK